MQMTPAYSRRALMIAALLSIALACGLLVYLVHP